METIIDSKRSYFEFLETNSDTDLIFRGVKSLDFKLQPKIGRIIKNNKNEDFSITDEKFMFELFKQKSYPYVDNSNKTKLEWLALGQHHGLPTRLLDWTSNPLIATYFACEEGFENDSLVYVFRNSKQFRIKNMDIESFDPFDISKYTTDILKYTPKHITSRIRSQSGLFTVHKDICKVYESSDIDKYIVKNSFRKELKKLVFKLGVNYETIYPGIDGVGKHIEWLKTRIH